MWNKQGVARRAGEIDRDKIRVTLVALPSLALSLRNRIRRPRLSAAETQVNRARRENEKDVLRFKDCTYRAVLHPDPDPKWQIVAGHEKKQ